MKKLLTSFSIFFAALLLIFLSNSKSTYEPVYYDDILDETNVLYLLENDLLVEVPVTVDSDVDEIFALLTEKANSLPLGVRTVVPYRMKLSSWEIIDEVLYLEIEDYQLDNLSVVLESLTWTFSSFDTIEALEVNMNGNQYFVSRNMGINKLVEASTYEHTKIVTIFKTNNYVTPISYIINDNQDEVEFAIKKLIDGDMKILNRTSKLMLSSDRLIEIEELNDFILTMRNSFDYQSISIYYDGDLLYAIDL